MIPSDSIAHTKALFQRLGPVRSSILGSVLLSLLAFYFNLLDRDGMLYMETARIYLDQGFKAALTNFAWPLHPILVAWLSKLTGFDLDTSRMLLMGLYQAGISGLLVAIGQRLHPESAWYLLLIVLILPNFNGHRHEFIREFGAWFFILLALWLALVWSVRKTWWMALTAQLSLGMAALYRPEALAIYPALVLWQWFSLEKAGRLRRTLQMALLPSLALLILIGLLLQQGLGERMTAEFHRLALANFQARVMALNSVLPSYGLKHAGLILAIGSLAIIPVTFVAKTKLLTLPLLLAFRGQSFLATLRPFAILAWAFGLQLVVLMVFVLEMQFVDGRYIAPLLLFAAPLMGWAIWRLVQGHPGWRWVILPLGLILALDNLHINGQQKTQFVEAGQWVAAHIQPSERLYLDSGRTAYHAGWGYSRWNKPDEVRASQRSALAGQQYDWLVLEFSRHEQNIPEQIQALGLESVREFRIPKGDTVLVARPRNQPQTQPIP